MSRNRVLGLVTISILLASMIWVIGCAKTEAADDQTDRLENHGEEKKINVAVAALEPAEFISHIVLVGEVESENDAVISGQVTAAMEEVRADKGSYVAKDDTLLILDARRNRAIFQMAEARLENARLDYSVAEKQHEQGLGVSETDFLKARNALKAAEADVANARVDLDNCYIIAPFSGQVAERFVEVGELVSPGSPLVRIVDSRNLRIKAGVPETQTLAVRKGAKAVVHAKGMDLEIDAKIRYIGTALDPRSRTLPIELEIATDNRLKTGMMTEVVIEKIRKTQAIVVPLAVLQKAPDHFFVFIHQNGRAVYKRVETGEIDLDRIEVISGLQFGDELILEGYRNLIDKQEVNVVGSVNG